MTNEASGGTAGSRKSILIVCRGFYPENSPRSHRATELAKEFARQGHSVAVLIPNRSEIHRAFEREHNVTIKDLGRTRWRAPDFGKSGLMYLLTRACVRFLQLGFEYPHIELMFKVKRALKEEAGYDLLISIAVPYPIHWGVAWARKPVHRIARTWVADCGDPYMGCDTDTFMKWPYFKYVERWFMRKADWVTIPIESARAAYYQEFHEKIRVIPQGVRFPPPRQHGTVRNAVPTFAYAGGFIPGIRDPRPLLEYLASLEEQYRFIVFTNSPDLLRPYERVLQDRLDVREYIPREELLDVLATMDFLVNFDNNTASASPSKLIDYAIAGRPVLNITKVLDPPRIQEFLHGDYKAEMRFENVDRYRIETVCRQFLDRIGDH